MSDPLELLLFLSRDDDFLLSLLWVIDCLELTGLLLGSGDGVEVADEERALSGFLDATDAVDVDVKLGLVPQERCELDGGVGKSHDSRHVLVVCGVGCKNEKRSEGNK